MIITPTRKNNLEENSSLTCFEYNYISHCCQQQHDVYGVMQRFIENIKPKRILEIGTSIGGFTNFLKIICNNSNLDCKILSYDVISYDWYKGMIDFGIDVRVENIFNNDYTEVDGFVKEFIKEPGTTIVFCDGGNKIKEFNLLSKYIKTGDYILAHDYAENNAIYIEKIKNKIWNWCEITEQDIFDAVKQHNLVDYEKESFNNVVWTCKTKLI